MTAATNEQSLLTFEGQQYAIDSLSDKAKEAVTGLQTAEAQIRMTQDQLRILSVGQQALVGVLQAELKEVEPVKAD